MEAEGGAFLMLVVIALVLLALGAYISVKEAEAMEPQELSKSIYELFIAVDRRWITVDEAMGKVDLLLAQGPMTLPEALDRLAEIAKSFPGSALGGA